jgi:hypothetical protein
MTQTRNTPVTIGSSSLDSSGGPLSQSTIAMRPRNVFNTPCAMRTAQEFRMQTVPRAWMMTIPWSLFAVYPAATVEAEAEVLYRREREAFEAMLPMLATQYDRQFVAVHNGAVVETGATEAEVVQKFFRRFGDTHVYVGYVGEDPPQTYQVSPLSAA